VGDHSGNVGDVRFLLRPPSSLLPFRFYLLVPDDRVSAAPPSRHAALRLYVVHPQKGGAGPESNRRSTFRRCMSFHWTTCPLGWYLSSRAGLPTVPSAAAACWIRPLSYSGHAIQSPYISRKSSLSMDISSVSPIDNSIFITSSLAPIPFRSPRCVDTLAKNSASYCAPSLVVYPDR
jgi:hypothetical protein